MLLIALLFVVILAIYFLVFSIIILIKFNYLKNKKNLNFDLS